VKRLSGVPVGATCICLKGFKGQGESRYQLQPKSDNFGDAKGLCANAKATLAVLNTTDCVKAAMHFASERSFLFKLSQSSINIADVGVNKSIYTSLRVKRNFRTCYSWSEYQKVFFWDIPGGRVNLTSSDLVRFIDIGRLTYGTISLDGMKSNAAA